MANLIPKFKGQIRNNELQVFERDKFKRYLVGFEDKEIFVSIGKWKEEKRTSLQNRALHKYFSLLAEELNNAGYDMRKTIKKDIDIAWSGISVKEYLWRPIQKTYLQEKSTTNLKTGDIDKIYDILNKVISERCGVSVQFPSLDNFGEIDYT